MTGTSAPGRGWIGGYTAIILIGVGIAVYAVSDLIRHPVSPVWLILMGLTVVSDWAMLSNPAMAFSFSISDTFSIAAALLFGPSAGATTAAVDGLVLSYRMSATQRTADRVLFNMAAPTIATWVAAQAFNAMVGRHPELVGFVPALRLLGSLTVFGLIDYGLNGGIVALAVSVERRLSFVAIWREHFAYLWLTYFGGIVGGMLAMLLARLSTVYVLTVLVPLPIILYMAFKHAVGRAQDQISHLGKVNRVYIRTIEALAQAVDAKDVVTHDHVRRVQDQAIRLARALDVDELDIQAIKAAALLHDVGKIAVPEHILNKPGRLTPAEYEIMKRHAPVGADILSVIDFPYPVEPIVRHHHESWDGSGYPDGIAGERIPIGARILAVVDCFDALVSDRPYRPRMEDREALQVLLDRRGTMYDPAVVDAFFTLHGANELGEQARVQAPRAPEAVPSAVQPPTPVPDGGVVGAFELETFFELGRTLSRQVLPAQLVDILWTRLRPMLGASGFVLYAYDESSDAIVTVHAVSDVPGAPYPARIALGDRLSGWVAATGQTVINSDARLDFDEAVREASPFRSALAVRVAAQERVVGVLTFYACDAMAFGHTHQRLVEAASRVVAAVVAESLMAAESMS